MSNLAGFNAEEVAESTYGAMPEGAYTMIITESEKKPTKAGTGEYLQMVMEVLDVNYSGKKIWVRLNLWNPNPMAVTIANQELASICKAVGVLKPSDSSDLHNKPFIGNVVVTKDNRDREQNEIKGYSGVGGAVAGNGMVAKPAAPAAPAAGKAPPWAK